MAKQAAVYILASRSTGALYIGVTGNLMQRIWHHRNIRAEGFTSRYAVHKLVYFEMHRNVRDALAREKRLKRWHQTWRLRIIEEQNPQWMDLWDQVIQ
ncbi:GIY-YIG nuclease family protein [Pseudohalioglobus lutimaris]|uniref:GIY-YIG domain-containing protein n=1 Tax=Pseudohalioglobus lutimaris TaxID=1737061 RepID=A0A2N5X2A5_9GAMM|nr:GIY-YIG nuclease family protein [Pseudohalioglobus lutimaris]PLW68624.1 hypothetical protein C0039_11450 [Pseudohalioglobus lutimaris]